MAHECQHGMNVPNWSLNMNYCITKHIESLKFVQNPNYTL